MNIDKDIEKINKLYYLLDNVYSTGLIENEERDEYQQAIENVLSELSNLKWKNEIYVKSIKSHKETIEKQDKELETYKKIAEKLAEDKIIPKCKNCSDEDMHECTECTLDWARKEVENEKI